MLLYQSHNVSMKVFILLRLQRKLNRTDRRILEGADVGVFMFLHGGGNWRTRRKNRRSWMGDYYPATHRLREPNLARSRYKRETYPYDI